MELLITGGTERPPPKPRLAVPTVSPGSGVGGTRGGVCGYEALTLPPGHGDLDLGLGGAECRMGAEIF